MDIRKAGIHHGSEFLAKYEHNKSMQNTNNDFMVAPYPRLVLAINKAI